MAKAAEKSQELMVQQRETLEELLVEQRRRYCELTVRYAPIVRQELRAYAASASLDQSLRNAQELAFAPSVLPVETQMAIDKQLNVSRYLSNLIESYACQFITSFFNRVASRVPRRVLRGFL